MDVNGLKSVMLAYSNVGFCTISIWKRRRVDGSIMRHLLVWSCWFAEIPPYLVIYNLWWNPNVHITSYLC